LPRLAGAGVTPRSVSVAPATAGGDVAGSETPAPAVVLVVPWAGWVSAAAAGAGAVGAWLIGAGETGAGEGATAFVPGPAG